MSDNGNIFDVDNLNADTHTTTAKKKKTAVVASAVVLLLLAGGGGGYIALNSNVAKGWVSSKEIADTRTPEEIAIEEKVASELENIDSNAQKPDAYFLEHPSPIKKEKWQLESSAFTEEERKETLKSIPEDSPLFSSGIPLPSEASGFTNDPEKQFTENGELNVTYSYWTKESFERDLFDHIETLINPIYGGWGDLQIPGFEEGEITQISKNAMFSQKFIEAHQGQKASSWLPIYADWNQDNYGLGDKLPALSYRWIGEVDSSELHFDYDHENSHYVVDGKVNIKFTTWTADKNKLEKNGVISFKAVPGEAELGNRIVFDEISLAIG